MTCTRKKIAIEVEVPDGATHYDINGGISISWYRLKKSIWTWWDNTNNTWRSFRVDYAPKYIYPIEVVE